MQKILSPRDLFLEIALKFEIKQSKTCTVTHKFVFAKELLRVTNGCSQKLSQLIAVYVVHPLLLACISSVYIDKELAWLRFERSTSSSRVSVKPFRKLLST